MREREEKEREKERERERKRENERERERRREMNEGREEMAKPPLLPNGTSRAQSEAQEMRQSLLWNLAAWFPTCNHVHKRRCELV